VSEGGLDSAIRSAHQSPIDGQLVVTANGDVALGIALHDASVRSGGTGTGSDITALNIACESASDGKIGVLGASSADRPPTPGGPTPGGW
jgi:hypothetical protein